MPKNAVVLLSGGLDSTTVLAIAKEEGFVLYALSFRYGQRHETELAAAARVATAIGAAEHVIADVNLNVFGGSALTAAIDVPKQRTDAEMSQGIPITYVPNGGSAGIRAGSTGALSQPTRTTITRLASSMRQPITSGTIFIATP